MQASKRLGGTYQRRQMPLLGVKMALCQLSTCSDARQIPLLGVKWLCVSYRRGQTPVPIQILVIMDDSSRQTLTGARLGAPYGGGLLERPIAKCCAVGTAMRALPFCPTFLVERDAWLTIFLQGPCWAS